MLDQDARAVEEIFWLALINSLDLQVAHYRNGNCKL